MLGDLTNGGNGDTTLAVFGRGVTPKFHRNSCNFVTLNNFCDPAEMSGDRLGREHRGARAGLVPL